MQRFLSLSLPKDKSPLKMVSNKGLHCMQNVEGKVISGTTTKTLMDSDSSIVYGMSKKTK